MIITDSCPRSSSMDDTAPANGSILGLATKVQQVPFGPVFNYSGSSSIGQLPESNPKLVPNDSKELSRMILTRREKTSSQSTDTSDSANDKSTLSGSSVTSGETASTESALSVYLSNSHSISAKDVDSDACTGFEVDGFFIAALNNPRDRVFLLMLDEEMESFVRDEHRMRLEFPPMNSYQRLVVHKVAAYFRLHHIVDTQRKAVVVFKAADSEIPDLRFYDFIEDNKDESASLPVKIIQRKEKNSMSVSNSLGFERKTRTLEEREAAYQKARARIFNETECPQTSVQSRSEPNGSEDSAQVITYPNSKNLSPMPQSFLAARSDPLSLKQTEGEQGLQSPSSNIIIPTDSSIFSEITNSPGQVLLHKNSRDNQACPPSQSTLREVCFQDVSKNCSQVDGNRSSNQVGSLDDTIPAGTPIPYPEDLPRTKVDSQVNMSCISRSDEERLPLNYSFSSYGLAMAKSGCVTIQPNVNAYGEIPPKNSMFRLRPPQRQLYDPNASNGLQGQLDTSGVEAGRYYNFDPKYLPSYYHLASTANIPYRYSSSTSGFMDSRPLHASPYQLPQVAHPPTAIYAAHFRPLLVNQQTWQRSNWPGSLLPNNFRDERSSHPYEQDAKIARPMYDYSQQTGYDGVKAVDVKNAQPPGHILELCPHNCEFNMESVKIPNGEIKEIINRTQGSKIFLAIFKSSRLAQQALYGFQSDVCSLRPWNVNIVASTSNLTSPYVAANGDKESNVQNGMDLTDSRSAKLSECRERAGKDI